jgi:hypothetical protein
MRKIVLFFLSVQGDLQLSPSALFLFISRVIKLFNFPPVMPHHIISKMSEDDRKTRNIIL